MDRGYEIPFICELGVVRMAEERHDVIIAGDDYIFQRRPVRIDDILDGIGHQVLGLGAQWTAIGLGIQRLNSLDLR